MDSHNAFLSLSLFFNIFFFTMFGKEQSSSRDSHFTYKYISSGQDLLDIQEARLYQILIIQNNQCRSKKELKKYSAKINIDIISIVVFLKM